MAWSTPKHRPATARPPAPRPEKVANPFYSSRAWRELREFCLARAGYRCEAEFCKSPNRGAGMKLEVDHIREISDGGAPLDPANCRVNCVSCHRKKTELEKLKRRR